MRVTPMLKECARVGREVLNNMRDSAWTARKATGKPVWSQALEIVKLRRGLGRLAPDEYYQYGLYDDQRYTWEQKQQFLGRRMEEGLIPILNEGRWLGLAYDKLITYAFLQGLGFPIPTSFAVYHAWRGAGGIPVLRSPEQLAAFVRQQQRPFLAKPILGISGRDVVAVRGYDAAEDSLDLADGTRSPVDDFVRRLGSADDGDGVILQELLQPHPAIQERCGDRLCTVRMIALVDRDGPRLLATIWKIATGRSMVDNYRRGANTNMVAQVDVATGVVGRPSTGVGHEFRYVERHPDTDCYLPGFVMPDWQQAVEICLSATASIPRLPMQAWDVALTERGPVLLEVNVNGGMTLPQVCLGSGIYQGPLVEFLAEFGYPRPTKRPSP